MKKFHRMFLTSLLTQAVLVASVALDAGAGEQNRGSSVENHQGPSTASSLERWNTHSSILMAKHGHPWINLSNEKEGAGAPTVMLTAAAANGQSGAAQQQRQLRNC